MAAQVVIGANFGDEGKGLVTDYLASKSENLVLNVLFNGGSQRGHTVVTPEDVRHVFSHFGSGTFTGAETLFTRDFICNPMTFLKEQKVLSELGFRPKIYMDRHCKITTPYDIAINQIVEEYRGDKGKHGSCGLGIFETINRYEKQSLFNQTPFWDSIEFYEYLRADWVPARLRELNIDPDYLPLKWKKILTSEHLAKNFDRDYKLFLEQVEIIDDSEVIAGAEHVIFEAGQGLLLDRLNGYYFPYLTPSNTGLTNVLTLASEASIPELDVYYVTRWYVTRHGAGPLMHELDLQNEWNLAKLEDKTNIYNDFQGSLRYGFLDLELLNHTIVRDLNGMYSFCAKTNPYLIMTCLDQVNDCIRFENVKNEVKADDVREIVSERVGIPLGSFSYGPTRHHLTRK